MVLVFNGVLQETVPTDTRTLYMTHPSYSETGTQLMRTPQKVVGPDGLLYIKQREFAATYPQDRHVTILGTDDMTTCITIIIRHSGSGACALSHLDGMNTENAICAMLQRIQELAVNFPDGRLELQIVGGFNDSQHYSEDIFYNIMAVFHKYPMEVDLILACVGELNTTLHCSILWPVICGIAINVKTGELFPATFTDKGPDRALRNVRYLTGDQQVLDIYDFNTGMLRIGPFHYEPLRGIDLWLEQSDELILQLLSTSPQIESPYFVAQIRETLKFIQENQFPEVTVFRGNHPHYFRRDEQSGLWIPFRY